MNSGSWPHTAPTNREAEDVGCCRGELCSPAASQPLKNVLVIGESSYIGASFLRYAGGRFSITAVSSRDGKWRDADFSQVDAVLHCAGLAHVPQKKDMKQLYYDVNCNLAVDVAQKAKAAGVKQFVFLSSMAVYGRGQTVITPATQPSATDFYGGSKLAAEEKLQRLASPGFDVCMVRPPMVYGAGCRGNFPRLVALEKKLPVFPNIQNRRSMVYIDNLCEFLCQAIGKGKGGICRPQNTEYVNTTELVTLIARLQGRNMRTTRVFNPLIRVARRFVPLVDKLFGDLVYERSGDEAGYNVVGFEDGVRVSVGL